MNLMQPRVDRSGTGFLVVFLMQKVVRNRFLGDAKKVDGCEIVLRDRKKQVVSRGEEVLFGEKVRSQSVL